MGRRLDHLKAKWGIQSTGSVIAILVVFSLAGISITQVRPILWFLFGFTAETSTWIKVVTYVALVFPMYQLFLVIYGALFGQFRFFWSKEKAMFCWIGRKLCRTGPRIDTKPDQEDPEQTDSQHTTGARPAA